MTTASLYPAIRPTLDLNFAATETLDPRITFSRASTGSYYDGKTVVKAEENLFSRSEELDNAAWTNSNNTITANATTAPNGTSTADKIVENTNASVAHEIRTPSVSLISGLSYTFSVFAKQSERRYVRIGFGGTFGTSNNYAIFDLVDGTNTYKGNAGLTVTSTNFGNDWYRISITYTVVTTASSTLYIGINNDSTTGAAYTGDGTSGLFAWGAQLEQRSTVTAYTPTTTAPITNYIPALQTAAANVARFDHDPVTGESKGLLIEEQRTNLLTYSQTLDTATGGWANTNLTVTLANNIAPDGTQTANFVQAAGTNNTPLVGKSGISANTLYTISIFVKAGTATHFHSYLSTANAWVCWRLSDGVRVSGSPGNDTTNYSFSNGVNVGNGWWRFSWSIQPSQLVAIRFCPLSYQSSGYLPSEPTQCTAFFWGAQLEAGSFTTSYIPTVASQVTRSADSASMTGSNFSSWYRADEGTFYINFADVKNTAASIFALDDGTTNQRILNILNGVTTQAAFRVVNGGVDQANFSQSTFTAFSDVKYASVYKQNDFAAVTNSGTVATDTSGTIPVVTTARIGQNVVGGSQINGTIKRIAYFPKRLSNTELQGLTS